MIKLAKTLDEASMKLYPFRDPLDPRNAEEFNHYYIGRTLKETGLKRAIRTAADQNTNFHWFYTGHTGSGKSTELFRVLADLEVQESHLTLYINLVEEYGRGNPEHTDIILSMARAAVTKARELKIGLPKDLDDYIDNWSKEVFQDQVETTETEGVAGAKIDLVIFKLGEEIKSGGGKTKTIRERMYNDITRFIQLVDQVAAAIADKTSKQVLFIIDGLDHMDFKPCRDMFLNHFVTLCRPKASSLFVIPLALLNTEFAINLHGCCSLVPNIKVFKHAGAEELDPDGLAFYKKVISCYAPLELFKEDSLQSLFRLSAGILRDMIRLTGDACHYAADDQPATQVEDRHVEKVWNGEVAFFRRILLTADYQVLDMIVKNPYPKGFDEVPGLIFRKAVIFYPNDEGWYGVHPAVQRILEQ